MIVVAGPRIDPATLPGAPTGLEVRAYVHDLYRHLAACDLAVVQGGLTTTMELTASRAAVPLLPARAPLRAEPPRRATGWSATAPGGGWTSRTRRPRRSPRRSRRRSGARSTTGRSRADGAARAAAIDRRAAVGVTMVSGYASPRLSGHAGVGEQSRARYPDAEGFAERDGQRLFYEVYGEGEETVFLLPTVVARALAPLEDADPLLRAPLPGADDGRARQRPLRPLPRPAALRRRASSRATAWR